MEQGTRVRGAQAPAPDGTDSTAQTAAGTTEPGGESGWRQRWEDRHLNDRWHWRRRIRADPRAYRIYRWIVGVVGVLLVLLGVSTGWLPGPGGIPLTLLGLAVLASEFRWAHRLFGWASARAQVFMAWTKRLPAWVRWSAATAMFVAVLTAMSWSAAVMVGLPAWLPAPVEATLGMFPGVD